MNKNTPQDLGDSRSDSYERQRAELTVRVFVGQPVVLAVLILKVGIALLTLLRSEVLKVLRTLLCIAQLELKIDTGAIFTSINGPVKRRTFKRF